MLKIFSFLKSFFLKFFFLSFLLIYWIFPNNNFSYSFNKNKTNFFSLNYQYSIGSANYNNRYDYSKINFYLFFSVLNNLKIDLNLPLLFVYDFQKKQNIENSGAIGDLDFTIYFLFKDEEYQFGSSLVIGYKLPLAPSFNNSRLGSKLNKNLKELIINDFYPLSSGNEEFMLGFDIYKNYFLNFLFLFRYVYEFSLSEGDLGNFFSIDRSRNDQFSLLGIEKIFQRLFYNPNLEDPWLDKLNDHFRINFLLEKKIKIKNFFNKEKDWIISPFVSLDAIKRFSEFSFYKSVAQIFFGYTHYMPLFFYNIYFSLPLFFEESYEYQSKLSFSVFFAIR